MKYWWLFILIFFANCNTSKINEITGDWMVTLVMPIDTLKMKDWGLAVALANLVSDGTKWSFNKKGEYSINDSIGGKYILAKEILMIYPKVGEQEDMQCTMFKDTMRLANNKENVVITLVKKKN